MDDQDRASPIAWPLALAGVTVLGTLATACMMPNVAVATIAAATMARAQAVKTVLGIWAANQLLGFGLLGFPLDANALGWGVALAGGGLVALSVARVVLGGAPAVPARLALAFVAAFLTYEGLLFTHGLVAGGTATFSAPIVLLLLGNDAAWTAGLAILHPALARLSPRLFATTPARSPA